MLNKTPPHDLEAEQVLLSCLIRNPGIRPSVKKRLSKAGFYDTRHQIIFEAVTGDGGDLVAIAGSLKMKGLQEKVGGQDYLMAIAAKSSTTAEYSHYTDIVVELWKRRQLMHLALNVVDKAGKTPAEDLASELRHGLQEIDVRDEYGYRAGVDLENVYDAEKCLGEYATYVANLEKNRFLTGVRDIDQRIRGVAAGEVMFIIARAGSFKTALLQNLLKNYVQNSAWAAVFFSLEMPIASITERYHEILSGASGRDVEAHYRSVDAGEHKGKLEQAYTAALKNLFIVPNRVSIGDIATYIPLIQKHYDIKIGVVGIDYLGLMEGLGKNEYEIVSRLARETKGLAKALNIPVIVIAQTSRRAGAGDVEITLDMARDSGAIEEAADFVLGLFTVPWQPQAGDPGLSHFEVVCRILKNRKGRADSKGTGWILDLDPANFRLGKQVGFWKAHKKEKDGF